MAFGSPMPGGPAPAPPGGAMPAPPDPEIVRIAESPTWDDVIAVLRSDKMRNYRIDIETDATVMEDANADKAARTEFMKVAGELLAQAYQAMTVAPQFLPVVKEMFMFTVRGFHAGRSLEETFEDAFDEMARQFKDNPPVPPGQEKASIQQDPNGDVKIQLEAEKVKNDAAAKQQDTQVKMAGVAADAKHNEGKLALESQKHQADTALKSRELDLQQRELGLETQRHALAVAAHNRQLITDAVQPQASPDGSVPTPGPVAGPLEGLMAQLGQMVQVLAQGQQQNQQQMTALIQMMAAPKRVLRGADGRAVGVEPVLQ